jgi:hypothetical protein
VVAVALSPAERAKRYRRRQRLKRGTQDLTLVGPGNTASLKHGAHRADVTEAAARRLPDLPAYLERPAFAETVAIARRRVVMAQRIGEWVAAMPEDEALTPAKAGSSSPAEISRQQDLSALSALAALGLTPQASARWGRGLEESGQPDLAMLHAAWVEDDAGA